ncbi:MAG: glycosyl transferase, partial [Deltaproteobacteria bacterium]|nr:glycosyl transferase [Deltaproteobacteria bacterium]
MERKGKIFGTLDPFLEPGPIMGRTTANAQFLEALLEADPFDEYHFFLPDIRVRDRLRAELADLRPDLARDKRIRVMTRLDLPARLTATDYHCFHLSDCITAPGDLARVRNRFSRRIFPITSTTHSLSRADYA